MTAYLEHGSARLFDSVTTLPRFPANMVGTSLQSIIQTAMDGVIVIDSSRQIVLVNRRAERMFGYPARHLLDKSVDILLPPRVGTEQRRRIERLSAIRVSGKRTRLGFRGLHANGHEFPVNASLSRITLRGEMYLAVTLHDTARHTPERKTRTVRTADLRKLAVSSQQANEVEKKRFSKELYDDIGQRLSVLKLDLDWLEHTLPETKSSVPERVAQMQGMLDKVITLTKSMASTLRPPMLDDLGLMPAVEWMADSFRKKTAVRCDVEGIGMPAKVGDPVKSAVFRVIQEGLLNIEKHAHATHVHIELEHTTDRLYVRIEDDGMGMEPGSENKPGCYGLIAMQERIFVLGGTITINNKKPQGVAIHASIPIDPLPAH
ncbi:MAG: domain S-box protein [Burkholderia sp.]|nr:domain S-box protein [Burkholderia sp.]